jgi:hypothetical protein
METSSTCSPKCAISSRNTSYTHISDTISDIGNQKGDTNHCWNTSFFISRVCDVFDMILAISTFGMVSVSDP